MWVDQERDTEKQADNTETYRDTENIVAYTQKRMEPNALQKQWLTSYF